jgi:hypothetical protein
MRDACLPVYLPEAGRQALRILGEKAGLHPK